MYPSILNEFAQGHAVLTMNPHAISEEEVLFYLVVRFVMTNPPLLFLSFMFEEPSVVFYIKPVCKCVQQIRRLVILI